MTSVQFTKNDSQFIGFIASGHTGYAASGEDIVCAAVSTLVQTTVLGLQKLLGLQVRIEQEKRTGYFSCFLPQEIDQEKLSQANLLFKMMHLGLEEIACQYKNHVTISIKEVEFK